MAVRIGIDIGSSTTKIVAFEGEHMLPPMAVKADSPGGIPLRCFRKISV